MRTTSLHKEIICMRKYGQWPFRANLKKKGCVCRSWPPHTWPHPVRTGYPHTPIGGGLGSAPHQVLADESYHSVRAELLFLEVGSVDRMADGLLEGLDGGGGNRHARGRGAERATAPPRSATEGVKQRQQNNMYTRRRTGLAVCRCAANTIHGSTRSCLGLRSGQRPL